MPNFAQLKSLTFEQKQYPTFHIKTFPATSIQKNNKNRREKTHFYIIIYSEGDAGPFFGFLNLELKYGGFL